MFICRDDSSNPEIEISATFGEYKSFGKKVGDINSSFFWPAVEKTDEWYPISMKGIRVCLKNSNPASLLELSLNEDSLNIYGDKISLKKLADSCINAFQSINQTSHFHIDYYEGSTLLCPTNCSLIFICIV